MDFPSNPHILPKMTIIYSTDGSIEGSASNGLYEWQRTFLTRYVEYFDVTLYSSDTRNYSEALGVRHIPFPLRVKTDGIRQILYFFYLVLRAPRMKGIIRAWGPHIPVLPLIKLLAGSPTLVLGFRFDWASHAKTMKRGLLRYLFGSCIQWLGFLSADLVLATTPTLKETAEKQYGKKAALIPNFVDKDLFRPSEKRRPVILYAGRLISLKGVDQLIRAFSLIEKKYPEVTLEIYGQGDQRSSLEQLSIRLGLNHIKFGGVLSQKDLAEQMRSSMVFVLPTVTMEGHPKALIEALACGVSCIVTDVQGNNDVIRNRVNGIIVPPGDAAAIEKSLQLLISQPNLRQKIETSARESASKYSMEKTLEKEIALLRSITEN